MNIGEIIKNKKVSIFFEDTGMKNNVIDINNENPNIGIFLYVLLFSEVIPSKHLLNRIILFLK